MGVLPTVCRRRSPLWLPPPSRSRSSLPPRGSTLSGSAAPSWPPSPPSSRCGSPSRSTTSAAPPSSTASASKSAPPPIHSGQKSFHIDVEICKENHVLLYRFSMYGKVNITAELLINSTALVDEGRMV